MPHLHAQHRYSAHSTRSNRRGISRFCGLIAISASRADRVMVAGAKAFGGVTPLASRFTFHMPHMTRAACEMLTLHRLNSKEQRGDVTYTYHNIPIMPSAAAAAAAAVAPQSPSGSASVTAPISHPTSGTTSDTASPKASTAGSAGTAGPSKSKAKVTNGSDFGMSLARAFAKKSPAKKDQDRPPGDASDKQSPPAKMNSTSSAAQNSQASAGQGRADPVRHATAQSAGQSSVRSRGQGSSKPTQGSPSSQQQLCQEHWSTPAPATCVPLKS